MTFTDPLGLLPSEPEGMPTPIIQSQGATQLNPHGESGTMGQGTPTTQGPPSPQIILYRRPDDQRQIIELGIPKLLNKPEKGDKAPPAGKLVPPRGPKVQTKLTSKLIPKPIPKPDDDNKKPDDDNKKPK